jgi:hypothetical protein
MFVTLPLIGVLTVIKGVILLFVSMCQYCGPQDCVLLLSCGQVPYVSYISCYVSGVSCGT